MSAAPRRAPRRLQLSFVASWAAPPDAAGRGGLLARDGRVRTLLGILLSYPEVSYVLPDRVGLDPASEPRVLETLQRFLERQRWLVRSVAVG